LPRRNTLGYFSIAESDEEKKFNALTPGVNLLSLPGIEVLKLFSVVIDAPEIS
jgi:hypothetical protein